jgi:hypothetical protein
MTDTQVPTQNTIKEIFFGNQPIQISIRKPRKHTTIQPVKLDTTKKDVLQ